MPRGTLKSFSSLRGYGFISPDDGSKNIIVRIAAVMSAKLGSLKEGQKLSYEIEIDRDGNESAINLHEA